MAKMKTIFKAKSVLTQANVDQTIKAMEILGAEQKSETARAFRHKVYDWLGTLGVDMTLGNPNRETMAIFFKQYAHLMNDVYIDQLKAYNRQQEEKAHAKKAKKLL